MSVQQRFCPLCDRAFDDGEAVLRCTGCGVLHHPGCWVANNGCATQDPHQSTPQAMAYPGASRPPGEPAPHPGEGTRTVHQPPVGGPIPFPQPAPRESQPAAAPPPAAAAPEPVIGAGFVRRQLPEDVAPPIGSGPRRYQPPRDEPLPRKPLPRIYDRHRWLGYWYIPAAVLLAIGVAFGLIWAIGQITGDDAAFPAPSPTAAAGGQQGPTPTPPAFATPSPSLSPGPGSPTPAVTASVGPGRFTAGQRLLVTGTGDCLNVRTSPGTENDAIVCLQDGAEVRVTGGPQQAGNFTWWKVQTSLGEGWAVENYLTPAP
ncbi:RING finger protein [Tepidiforma sp.]|uniref:RING finger protein n=1 Tax=Tepidiforma sp. TaxID=2682230 RepID=UPI0026171E5B|nr:RING finger protein [Tepidiforma sp.]MCX7616479.1 hypothetical protein [Tepidiforma sp.]